MPFCPVTGSAPSGILNTVHCSHWVLQQNLYKVFLWSSVAQDLKLLAPFFQFKNHLSEICFGCILNSCLFKWWMLQCASWWKPIYYFLCKSSLITEMLLLSFKYMSLEMNSYNIRYFQFIFDCIWSIPVPCFYFKSELENFHSIWSIYEKSHKWCWFHYTLTEV